MARKYFLLIKVPQIGIENILKTTRLDHSQILVAHRYSSYCFLLSTDIATSYQHFKEEKKSWKTRLKNTLSTTKNEGQAVGLLEYLLGI